MVKKPLKHKRERFFATEREQEVIRWLRDYSWNSYVSGSVTKAIGKELDHLKRQKVYLKQDKQETSTEYEELTVSIGLLEVFYIKWRELMRELTEER